MMFRRSALGVMAGLLLALGVVALAGSGLNQYVMQASSPKSSLNPTTVTSARSMTTASSSGDSGSKTTNSSPGYTTEGATPLFSHLDSFARQPVALTGFVLLPIFAALLFGFVLYRISRVRNEEEELSEVA
jgi:hypothetical protein